ncbi:hypothetical protein PJL18_00804 [Paenarthrobacter nicotinovorans]|nr:hypothetical protein [Paenarthrobacter nicotinovorans]
MRRPQGFEDGFRDDFIPAKRRHDHEVGIGRRLKAKVDVQGESGLHADVPRLRGNDTEVKGRNSSPAVRSVDPENLEGRAELEHGEVRNHDHCDCFQHTSSVAENYLNGAFLPLFLAPAQEQSGDMEIFGIILFIVLITAVAATISALLKDGRGHNPPVTSREPWSAFEAPSAPYWNPRIY